MKALERRGHNSLSSPLLDVPPRVNHKMPPSGSVLQGSGGSASSVIKMSCGRRISISRVKDRESSGKQSTGGFNNEKQRSGP